jgi:hypothetical protein
MIKDEYQSRMVRQLATHWSLGEFDEYEHKIETLAQEYEDDEGDLVIGDRDYIERLVQQELEAAQ